MKQNMIVRSAVAAAFGGVAVVASAGSIGVASLQTYATESATSTALQTPAVTYQTAVPLNANGNFYVFVKPDGGASFSTPSELCLVGPSGTSVGGATAGVGLAVTGDTAAAAFQITVPTGGVASNALFNLYENTATSPCGNGTTTGALAGTAAALGTGGAGVINVTWTMSTDAATAGVPATNIVDTIASAPIVKSAAAVKVSVINSADFTSSNTGDTNAVAEAAKIDLVGTSKGKQLIGTTNTASTGLVAIGAVTATVNTNYKNGITGANMAPANFAGLQLTLNGDLSAASNVVLSDKQNCTGTVSTSALAIDTAGLVSATTGTTTYATFVPGALVAGGTQATGTVFLCVTEAGAKQIKATQYSLTGKLVKTTASSDVALSGNLYNLVNNAASVIVPSYVPSANLAFKYTNLLRVVNTGSSASTISVAVYDNTTGATGTTGALPGTLAAGASRIYTAAEVEAATGAVAGTDWRALQVTANTNALEVQSLLSNPDGTITVLAPVNSYNAGASKVNSNQ